MKAVRIHKHGKLDKLIYEDLPQPVIESGKMIVEGKNLYDSDSNFIKDRRKFSFEGIILVTLLIYKDFTLHKNMRITSSGLPSHMCENINDSFKEKFISKYLSLNNEKKSSDLIISELVKKTVRGIVKEYSSKKPEVNSHIIRI